MTMDPTRMKGLKTFFYAPFGTARAVNGVSWSLDQRKILGIVEESGCRKSVTALSIIPDKLEVQGKRRSL